MLNNLLHGLRRKHTFIFLLIITLVSLVFLLLLKWSRADIAEQKYQFFYRSMMAYTTRQDANTLPSTTIFIGDSHVQGLAAGRLANSALNLGIGGDTSRTLLTRWPYYTSLNSAAQIYIGIGINDLLKAEEAQLLANLHAIIALAPKHTPILLGGLLPVAATAQYRKNVNALIGQYNQQLKELSEKYENVEFVDYQSVFSRNDGSARADLLLNDGLHLNPAGYEVFIQVLAKHLNNTEQHSAAH
jgi:lysophospholipase L1-like esterase